MTWRAHIADVLDRMARHDSGGRGAQLGFFALLAVFPLVLSLVGLLSAFHLESQVEALRVFIEQSLPSDQAAIVMREAERVGARSGWPLALGVLVSAYYAGRGVLAVLRGVALAWRRRPVKIWKAQLAATLFGGGVLFFALLVFVVLMLANVAIGWARSRGLLVGGWELLSIARWPVLVFTFHACVRLAYRLGAGPKWSGRWFSPGSVAATLGWLVLSQGFEAYLDGVMDLGATYGSLGGTVGLLLYFHIVSTLVFVGAEIDAHLQCGKLPTRAQPASTEPETTEEIVTAMAD